MINLYMNTKKMFLGIGLLCMMLTSFAQETQKFTGTVKSQDGNPVSGATIGLQERDAANTTTDAQGKFSIETTPDAVLIVSYNGYLTQLVPLKPTSTDFTITLITAKFLANDMDDVYLPYGIKKKRYLTEAVSQIKTTDMPQPLTSQLTSLFAGRLPGLRVLQGNTQPGDDASSFNVRGVSSLGSRNATVFVDGVQREFADLDLNEIESVTVLKDAASLAYYGLRGGDGVILVNTRKGDPKKTQLRLDAQYGFQNVDHLIDPLNSFEYASLYNEAFANDGSTVPFYSQTALDAYQNGTDPILYPNNNYVDRFIDTSSPYVRSTFSAEGGSSRVQYFALLGVMDQDGIFKNTNTNPSFDSNNGYQRYNFRGNVNFDISNDLNVGVYLGGRIEKRTSTGDNGFTSTQQILNNIYSTRPNAYPILRNDSLGGNNEFRQNILGDIQRSGVANIIQRVGLANINANYKLGRLLKGLSAHALFSYDVQGNIRQGFGGRYQVFDFTVNPPQAFNDFSNINYNGGTFGGQIRNNEFWAGFNYDNTFKEDHAINSSIRYMLRERREYPQFSQRYAGVSGKIDYSFKNRYLLGFTASYMGDDDLPDDDKLGFFPAVSAGWIISEEEFLSGNSFLSFLKLRGSYGDVGYSELAYLRRFPYLSRADRSFGNGGYLFGNNPTNTGTAFELNIGNPFITYERMSIANLGVEIGLFNNALYATVDLYRNNRKNILGSPNIPSIIGQQFGEFNNVSVKSSGIETSLNYSKKLGDFEIGLNGNLLISDSEITEFTEESALDYQFQTGLSSGSPLLYISDGLYQNQAEIAAGPLSTLAGSRERTLPGDIRYKDLNNDGLIDANDRTRVDYGNPNFYGFGGLFKYKFVDLNFQFAGAFNRNIDIRSIVYAGPDGLNRESLDRWTPSTASTAKYPRLGISTNSNNDQATDFWIRDANFLKLKTIELGFNVSPTFSQKIGMQGLRIYASAFNPLTISSLGQDVDPELPFLGRNNGTYPYLRTYALGLTARF